MMTRGNQEVENFLQSVCTFIKTEEKALEIRDELNDHISSHIEAYQQRGYNKDAATQEALKQIGDPNSLRQYYSEPLQKYLRLVFASCIGICVLAYIGYQVLSLVNHFSLVSSLFILLGLCCIGIPYSFYVIFLMNTHKKSRILASSTPLFYIHYYKQTTLDEWMLKCTFALVSLSLILPPLGYLLDLYLTPTTTTLNDFLELLSLLPTTLLCLSICYTFQLNQKNNVVYEQGLLTFTGFIPWSEIAGYRWQTEHFKGKPYYQLQIKLKKQSFKQILMGKNFISPSIKVSKAQIKLMNELMDQHSIPYKRYM